MVNTHSTILQDFNWRYLKHCKTLLVGSCGFLYNPSWHKEYKKPIAFAKHQILKKVDHRKTWNTWRALSFWARVVDKRTPCLEMAYWMSSQYTRNKNVDWCCNQTTEMLKGIWRILTCRMILKLDLIYIINEYSTPPHFSGCQHQNVESVDQTSDLNLAKKGIHGNFRVPPQYHRCQEVKPD